MSHNNDYIRNLLNIKDNNIKFFNVFHFKFSTIFCAHRPSRFAGWTVPFVHRASSFIFRYFIPASLCTGLRNSRAFARQTGTKALLLCLKLLRRRRGHRRNHRPEAVGRARIAIAVVEVKRARNRAIVGAAATREPGKAGERHI